MAVYKIQLENGEEKVKIGTGLVFLKGLRSQHPTCWILEDQGIAGVVKHSPLVDPQRRAAERKKTVMSTQREIIKERKLR